MNVSATIASFNAAVASLPSTHPETELHRLWIAAADAADAFHAVCGPNAPEVSDYQFSRLQEAQYETERALRDYLLNEHRLTSAELRRSVL